MTKEELIPIGKITGAHGIRGEVKLAPYGPLDELVWEMVFIESPGGEAAPVKILARRLHKGTYLLTLEGVPDRNAAEALSGREAMIPRSELPDPDEDEYYHSDLAGMEVVSEDGKELGKVTGIFPTGGNDVLEVDGPFGEVLIPLIENVVIRVEPDRRRITVRLMEGLLPEQGGG